MTEDLDRLITELDRIAEREGEFVATSSDGRGYLIEVPGSPFRARVVQQDESAYRVTFTDKNGIIEAEVSTSSVPARLLAPLVAAYVLGVVLTEGEEVN